MSENEIHAHIESESTDCDGRYTSGHTMTLNDAERAESAAANGVNDFSDIHFTDRVVASMVNAYSLIGKARLEVYRLDDGDVRLVWSESTDEGYRTAEATICRDQCELDTDSWQRDHAAEAAGY